MQSKSRAFLTALFDAAIAAAEPKSALAPYMPDRPKGRTVVVGAGKGVAQLAAAFEELWDGPLEGAVVTRYGYSVPCRSIRVLEASHPIPDAAGLVASETLLSAVAGLTKEDLVVALICGGGSALLPAPPDGLSLADEQALNRQLLRSGAPIGVMNAIRKHVSRIKGGRLAAAAYPAKVVSLVISDVPGDDPAQVASGPTVPSAIGLPEVRKLICNHDIVLPSRIAAHLRHEVAEAPDPLDLIFANVQTHIIASARLSLEAAAAHALSRGVPAAILSDAIEGEARDVGLVHAAIAREVTVRNRPFSKPVVLLSGGETTVTMKDTAGRRGGRNSEFLLSFASAIEGLGTVEAIAADTDGIDGSEDNAGAFANGSSMARMRAVGVEPMAALSAHDAWGAFHAVDDLFLSGPTGTNVNDFRAILIQSES